MITEADALNEPLDERLFSDDAPQVRRQTTKRVYVDTPTPLGEKTQMNVYIALNGYGTYTIYNDDTGNEASDVEFQTRQQAVRYAQQQDWIIID